MTAVPATVFTNSSVWLRVWFDDGASGSQRLSPDQRVAAVGYAMMAGNIPDGLITSSKLANGAVTTAKLADGAVTGVKIASNSITSLHLSNNIGLGTSNTISGQLHVYRTLANTPGVSIFGNGSQISTYGSDGLEQVRLWGTGWGQILLNDDIGNDNTVALNANTDGGGSLFLYHSNNAYRATIAASTAAGDLRLYSTNNQTRAQLHGGTDGSYLNLFAADGTSGLYLDGDDSGGGSISLRNTNGSNRVYLDGQGQNGGGQINLYTGDGGYGALLYGDSGGGGLMYLYNTNGAIRLSLDGLGSSGGGQIYGYANDGTVTVNIQGDSGGSGLIDVRNGAGSSRVSLVGTNTSNGGEVQVKNSGALEVALLQGTSYGGALNLYDSSLDPTVRWDSSGSGGGYGYLYKANSSSAGLYLDGDSSGAGYLGVYGTNGITVISLDGQDANGSGRITTEVLQITGGSDLSEQFDVKNSGAETEPGMVVCIHAANPGELVISTTPYDRSVAGIISGAGGVSTGMLMGQKGTKADGKYPVALTGRVYCLADASTGAIEAGDLLTTSATPGHAMKVTEHARAQGAVIGKAMSSLPNGKGLVLVLVSLQ